MANAIARTISWINEAAVSGSGRGRAMRTSLFQTKINIDRAPADRRAPRDPDSRNHYRPFFTGVIVDCVGCSLLFLSRSSIYADWARKQWPSRQKKTKKRTQGRTVRAIREALTLRVIDLTWKVHTVRARVCARFLTCLICAASWSHAGACACEAKRSDVPGRAGKTACFARALVASNVLRAAAARC